MSDWLIISVHLSGIAVGGYVFGTIFYWRGRRDGRNAVLRAWRREER